MPSDLRFPPTHERKGFSTDATARRDGSPEPVVRELLQNSLDAAKEIAKATPNHPAEVVFTISECAWNLIPGGEAYRRAFHLATEHRRREQEDNLSPDENRVIRRVQSVLDGLSVRILYCRDNGIGISHMERVLFEGNSSKPREGGGSIGVGHMTAFAASDLRYVLYAGQSNPASVVAGGHAILAAHVSNNTLFSGDGYYTSEDDLMSYDPNNATRYHADLPPLLQGETALISDTGSVVCITGFNDFRGDENPVDAICRVAATNFVAAIQRGEFIIRVQSEDESKRVDSTTLGEILVQRATERRAQAQGWLAGRRAFRSWETLSEGYRLSVEGVNADEVEVWFRSLPDSSNDRTQVNIFRDGMWITFEAPGLNYSNFGGVRPFDCVVLLHRVNREGSLYQLVRSAEGPEHCGLENYRALERSERQDIQDQFSRIVARLREEAGESDSEEYTPPGFAIFQADLPRDAAIVPAYRPRMPEGQHPTPDPGPGPNPGPGPGPGPGPNPNPRPRPSPRPGTAAAVRRSFKPVLNTRGETESIAFAWEPQSTISSRLAVRLKVISGSDQTCEDPFIPQWLEVTGLDYNGIFYSAGEDNKEILLPAQQGTGLIHLAQAILDSSGVEPDIVLRSLR